MGRKWVPLNLREIDDTTSLTINLSRQRINRSSQLGGDDDALGGPELGSKRCQQWSQVQTRSQKRRMLQTSEEEEPHGLAGSNRHNHILDMLMIRQVFTTLRDRIFWRVLSDELHLLNYNVGNVMTRAGSQSRKDRVFEDFKTTFGDKLRKEYSTRPGWFGFTDRDVEYIKTNEETMPANNRLLAALKEIRLTPQAWYTLQNYNRRINDTLAHPSTGDSDLSRFLDSFSKRADIPKAELDAVAQAVKALQALGKASSV